MVSGMFPRSIDSLQYGVLCDSMYIGSLQYGVWYVPHEYRLPAACGCPPGVSPLGGAVTGARG